MSIIRERHEVIMSWLNEAAENIRRALQSELDVSQKTSPRDLVTNMDKETEDYLTGKILHPKTSNEEYCLINAARSHINDPKSPWLRDI